MQQQIRQHRTGAILTCAASCAALRTHTNHDAQHESLYRHLAQAVRFFWDYAGDLGIADRITLVIGSDFGRTPHYNETDGKDHWPIGSYIVMSPGAPWGNRVVGVTDGGHNAYKINPTTLQRDDANGTIIYPKHVHDALRSYLGIQGTAAQLGLAFNNAEHIDFFNPARQTSV